jgi:fido (protein-threonine AMPylation protein)
VTLENIYQHDENAEIVYLGRLISDFGIQSDLRAEEAIKKIYSRFSELEKKRSNILKTINYTPSRYYQLCIKVHAFLYQDILNTAGKVRASSDPNFGNVYFGAIDQRTMKDKFIGTEPAFIKLELDEAFLILFDNKYTDYRERSIRFYAEFVAIHPFYDANGRIGRYIVDTYLQHHHYYVDWQSIYRTHNKFLRKLNYCHSVRIKYKQCLARFNPNSDNLTNEEAYWESIRGKYIGYLVNYWNQSVGSIVDLEI